MRCRRRRALTRLPDGAPEGFLEGFATIYSDAAELIWAPVPRAAEPDPSGDLAADGAGRAGRHALHRGPGRFRPAQRRLDEAGAS